MDKDCYVNIKGELLEAEFIGVYQYSEVINPSPMKGGHSGGTIAYPIAIIKQDGKFKQVNIYDLTFKM